MNRSKPSMVVGGAETNRATSGALSNANNDGASDARSALNMTFWPSSVGASSCVQPVVAGASEFACIGALRASRKTLPTCPGEVEDPAISPQHVVDAACTPHDVVIPVGAPHDVVVPRGTPDDVVVPVGAPDDVVIPRGTPNDVVIPVGAPDDVVVPARSAPHDV